MEKENSTKISEYETIIEKLSQASGLIASVDLTSMALTKFDIRRGKIEMELNSFIEAIQRKSTVIKKKISKLKALRAKIKKLEQENQ